MRTILVVEDEDIVRRTGRRILEQHGHRVLVARDGEEALFLVEKHGDSMHLLLTDIVMPTMSGKELYQKIRIRLPGLKVLYTSGYPPNIISQKGDIEDEAFLRKPFDVISLTRKVREVLKR